MWADQRTNAYHKSDSCSLDSVLTIQHPAPTWNNDFSLELCVPSFFECKEQADQWAAQCSTCFALQSEWWVSRKKPFHLLLNSQGQIQILVRGALAEFFFGGGSWAPKCAQNRGVLLKIAWNWLTLKKILGARGGALFPKPPGSASYPSSLLSFSRCQSHNCSDCRNREGMNSQVTFMDFGWTAQHSSPGKAVPHKRVGNESCGCLSLWTIMHV